MYFLFFLILVTLDQASKYYFEHSLQNTNIPLISEYFSLHFARNMGIAFSFPIEGLLLKMITVILTLAVLVYFLRYEKLRNKTSVKIAYTLILAGAVGNGIDRIFSGSVTDFIAVKYFAIFNFADIFVSIGAFLLVLAHLEHERSSQK